MKNDDVAGRLAAVRVEIAAAAAAAGRAPTVVRLVAASKGQPPDAIRAAWLAGQRDFGENYARELVEKQAALADLQDLVWHFIGRVQHGNARAIAGAAIVHGVGSESQAAALDKAARQRGLVLPVLLQVNLVDEETKNGFSAAAFRAALPALRAFPHLRVRGLMAMPNVPPSDRAAAFAAVRRLRDELCPDVEELSMGMSDDFTEAIAEGATMVRVGTRVFGPRPVVARPEVAGSDRAIRQGDPR
jgi:pyridoxal phosphate enzyme (YggS family)